MLQEPKERMSRGYELEARDALERLGRDANDARALISIYEQYEREFKQITEQWFGVDREFCDRVVTNILTSVAKKARSYDPGSLGAEEWILLRAIEEAESIRSYIDGRLTDQYSLRRERSLN
jgi:hypothetical protein